MKNKGRKGKCHRTIYTPVNSDLPHLQLHDPSVKVSVLAMCMLSFMYNSAKVGKCYIVNLIT